MWNKNCLNIIMQIVSLHNLMPRGNLLKEDEEEEKKAMVVNIITCVVLQVRISF